MKTTVNGKEIQLLSRNDIYEIVSEITAEKIANGYTLYFLSGSQGEEGKVCFTNDNGKTVLVYWIHKEYESIENDSWHSDQVMYITGKKYEDVYIGKTLWFNKGEKFFEKKFYGLESKNELYVSDIEDFKAIQKIHERRRSIRYEVAEISSYKKIVPTKAVLNVIRKQRGYKSVSLREIDCVFRKFKYGYIINFVRDSKRNSLYIQIAK